MKYSIDKRCGKVICGQTRFTVISPTLIRLEYDRSGGFCDLPSLFAQNRDAYCGDFDARSEDGALVLTTAALRLRWKDDGSAFGADNLSVELLADGTVWKPGMKNSANLGGPLQCLDNVEGPVALSEGLLTRDGWFLLDNSQAHVLQDGWVASRRALPVDKNSDWPSHQPRDWYFFGYGHDYRQGLKDLVRIGGDVPLPRRALMGSWYCRWHPYSSQDYRGIVQEYADRGFPLDILVFDMEWQRHDAYTGVGDGLGLDQIYSLGWTGWSVNRRLLPDFEALLDELKGRHIEVCLNVHPHDGIRQHEDCWAPFMRELGKDPAVDEPLPFSAGDRQYMQAYFKHAHEPLERDGVSFWWVDWQQDHCMPWVSGKPWLRHVPWLNALYYRHTARQGRRGVSFSRWGGWGDHKHPIHFSGDVKATWASLAFEVEFTLASGNAGCFFWSHDIGGFSGDRQPELYARWAQFGAVSAAMRLHSFGENLDRRPWLWEQPAADSLKRSFELRTELFPYVYTAASQCHRAALPLLRPMYLDYGDRPEAYEHPTQFMLGDHLLVSPICQAGSGPRCQVEKTVWLPPGQWWDWFTGQCVEGDRVITVCHDIDSFPLFVRAGAVIPTHPSVRTHMATLSDEIVFRCFEPAGDQPVCSLYYEDDGATDAYRQGVFHRTDFQLRRCGGRSELLVSPCGMGFPWRGRAPSFKLQWHGRGAAAVEPIGLVLTDVPQTVYFPGR